MTLEQQKELARQEVANLLSRAVWFENTLNQGLLMQMLRQDPTSSHVHYELTELGDETRHMIMFGKGITAIGAEPYRLSFLDSLLIQAFPVAYRGVFLWVAALCGEEWIDQMQRKHLNDERIQPIIRRIMQIHVTEEARHISFAREGVRRELATSPSWLRHYSANLNGLAAGVLDKMTISPAVYKRCGLDVGEALKQARTNEHLLAERREFFEPMWAFFGEVGLAGPIAKQVWRRYGFLA